MQQQLREQYIAAGLPLKTDRITDERVIAQIDRFVRSRFTYKRDELRIYEGKLVRDEWRSYASEVLSGKTFSDDCDSFAYTCVELALVAGIDPEKLMLVWVDRAGHGPDHMVAGYGDPHENFTVFGDTLGGPRYLKARKYSVFRFRTMKSPQWFEINK